MGMNGYLLAIEASLADRLRSDPSLVVEIVTGQSLAGLGLGALGGELASGMDEMLAEALPGCVWRWWPGLLRRWLLGRMLPRAAAPAPVDDEAVRREVERLRAEARAAGLEVDEEADEEAGAAGRPKEVAAPNPDPPPAIDGVGELLSLHKDWHLVHYLVAGTAGEPQDLAGRAVLGGEEVGEDLGYGPARLLTPAEVTAIAAALTASGADALFRRFRPADLAAAEVYSAEAVPASEARHQLDRLLAFYARSASRGQAILLWLS